MILLQKRHICKKRKELSKVYILKVPIVLLVYQKIYVHVFRDCGVLLLRVLNSCTQTYLNSIESLWGKIRIALTGNHFMNI